MISAWDGLVRIWLVFATWLAVRKPPRLDRLARIREPLRFVRAAMLATGRRTDGQVALAIAMLPRRRRTEATIAFVACRTLHAIDALSTAPADAGRRVTSAIAYLVGEASGPTRLDTRGPRNFDAVLAARMALVRAALDSLPGDATRRCYEIIERIGEGLLRARVDQAGSADQVRGEAVIYAIRLAAPAVRPPITACKAAGGVITLRRALRAAPGTRQREAVLDHALPALAFVPRLMRWLPVRLGPGTRAAVTMLVTALYPFTRPELASTSSRRLRHPLRAALAAACSRRAYLATATAIEDVLHDARTHLMATRDGLAIGSAVSTQLGAPTSDAALIARALERVQVVTEALAPRVDGAEAERETSAESSATNLSASGHQLQQPS
jgi:hypothetical protein